MGKEIVIPMRYSVQFTNRCVFVGFVAYPYVYTSTGLSAGLNLWLAMIQEDYGAYVAASVGEELLSGRFSHKAVNHVVRVEVK
jgi:transcriptional regulator GlxA family with amidase domain